MQEQIQAEMKWGTRVYAQVWHMAGDAIIVAMKKGEKYTTYSGGTVRLDYSKQCMLYVTMRTLPVHNVEHLETITI